MSLPPVLDIPRAIKEKLVRDDSSHCLLATRLLAYPHFDPLDLEISSTTISLDHRVRAFSSFNFLAPIYREYLSILLFIYFSDDRKVETYSWKREGLGIGSSISIYFERDASKIIADNKSQ